MSKLKTATAPRQTITARRELVIAAVLILVGVVLRIACSDLPNVAPVAAIGLFAGFYLSRKSLALFIPLTIMVLSNIHFGGYQWPVMLSVYGCYLVMPLLGSRLRRGREVAGEQSSVGCKPTTFVCAVAGSLLFFAVTNFAVWISGTSQLSLWECYAIAIPFFRLTLCGDLFFAFAFFAGYDLLRIASTARQPLAHAGNSE